MTKGDERGVDHHGLLAVEQRHLRRLQDVGPRDRPAAASIRKNASMSLRIAKPNVPPSRLGRAELRRWRDRSCPAGTACRGPRCSWGSRAAGWIEAHRGAGALRLERRRPAAAPFGTFGVRRDARAVFDVEVEVDADPFEEAVREPDEPHLDRHLQVLQAAKLLQQIGDLLVHPLRLADDQAQVGRERLDFAFARAVFHPAVVLDSRDDQVDERIEVGTAPRRPGRRGRRVSGGLTPLPRCWDRRRRTAGHRVLSATARDLARARCRRPPPSARPRRRRRRPSPRRRR